MAQLVAALDRWVGGEVSVRVVSNGNHLLTVFRGKLGERSADKGGALFWPLTSAPGSPVGETPGVYLHPERFQSAAVHTGGLVLEVRQDNITLNLRRLR